KWEGGSVGVFEERKGYGGIAKGEKGEKDIGTYPGYGPLVVEIGKYFDTGKIPVQPKETLEIYAFMEAADESKRQNGAEVTLESVMKKAEAEAKKRLADIE
ncbi:MAG: gfo/Idh/MocA family oxidoreductase, partial [Verrucomicrobiales bacterium]|nr:gfo/Idh/MocA family oxidoreductase [Verrucomicrobiales bacterium]